VNGRRTVTCGIQSFQVFATIKILLKFYEKHRGNVFGDYGSAFNRNFRLFLSRHTTESWFGAFSPDSRKEPVDYWETATQEDFGQF
jgi:hypothetical protein